MPTTTTTRPVLETFLAEEQPRLVRTLSSYTGDRDLAEELAAEALARMVRDWDHVGDLDAPGAYAHRTAINLANSWFRRRAAERRATARRGPDRDVHHDPDTPDAIAVREAVAALPERQRAALALHHVAGFTSEEVGRQLGVAAGTVRSDLHRARTTLRDALGVEPEIEPTVVRPRITGAEVRDRGAQLARRRTVAVALAVLLGLGAAVGFAVSAIGDVDVPIVGDEAAPVGTFADGAVVVAGAGQEPELDLLASPAAGLPGVVLGPIGGPVAVVAHGPDGTLAALSTDGQLTLRRDGSMLAMVDASDALAEGGGGPLAPAVDGVGVALAVDDAGRALLHAGAPESSTVVALAPDGSIEVLREAAPLSGATDGVEVTLEVTDEDDLLLRLDETGFSEAGLVVTSRFEAVRGTAPADEVTTLPIDDPRPVNGGQVLAAGLRGTVFEGEVVIALADELRRGAYVGASGSPGYSGGVPGPQRGGGVTAVTHPVTVSGEDRVLLVAVAADGRTALVDAGPMTGGTLPTPIVAADGSVAVASPTAGRGIGVRLLLGPDLLPTNG